MDTNTLLGGLSFIMIENIIGFGSMAVLLIAVILVVRVLSDDKMDKIDSDRYAKLWKNLYL